EFLPQIFENVEGDAGDGRDHQDLPHKVPVIFFLHTKIVTEDRQRGNVDSKGEDLSNNHQVVPVSHIEAHHEQLSEDEGRECDAHNMDELSFK
ncbi:hypothetical protein EGW08_018396, partial [Elysia chlorotica]